MRLSTVILPLERWSSSSEKWQRAEALGFHAAYTYDHLSWLRLQDRPWFGALPTLAAASLVTSNLRLGTLVTSPNFREPVPLAKDLLSLDDLSKGRLTVGVGSGGTGNDANVIGQASWSARERTARFEEFVRLLDTLLRKDVVTYDGEYYHAHEARMLPGSLQRPRPPFYVAAHGKRGVKLAAELGQGWVTFGRSSVESETCFDAVSAQVAQFRAALEAAGRHDDVERVLLDGLNDEQPLRSLDAFVDWAGRYQELGITELVVHWPEPNSIFESNPAIFEDIALHGLTQL